MRVVSKLRVLDAGCGRRCAIDFPDAHVTGLDTSREALDLNPALDARIIGDVETYALPPESFDVIVCHDVLEHLPHPERALDNLVRALAPGGELHLGLPNVLSARGLATKLTPQWVHVWYYRRVKGSATAGKPGYGPFKTYLRLSLRPARLRHYASTRGLSIESLELYEAGTAARDMERSRLVRIIFPLLIGAMRLASLGTANPRLSDIELVLAKPSH